LAEKRGSLEGVRERGFKAAGTSFEFSSQTDFLLCTPQDVPDVVSSMEGRGTEAVHETKTTGEVRVSV
jgi:hypothetical protein